MEIFVVELYSFGPIIQVYECSLIVVCALYFKLNPSVLVPVPTSTYLDPVLVVTNNPCS